MPGTYLEEKSFFFETSAQSPSTGKPYAFNVVRFTGSEAISRPYEFDVTIATKDREVDLAAMLENPCVLYLRPGRKLPVHGILSTLEQLNEVDGNIFFRAVLVPKLWQLSLYDVSEVYLDMAVPQIIEQVLKEGGLGSADFELRLVREYRTWSFVCQYQETHLNFISRWMEREGIYYFFEQTEAGEKLIISDTSMVHVDLPEETTVHYSPPSGMEVSAQKEAVTNFVCRQVPVPKKVTLQDFNYRKSPPIVKGEAEVSPAGRGEVLIYGEHVKNNQEATEYAKLRAQEILCRQRIYWGEGTAAFLRVGYFFYVDRHYQKNFNRAYLLTRIDHAGSQAALLMAGVGVGLSDEEQRPYYRNTFEGFENDLQFRPERVTPKPRFYGTINAKVEAEGDGKYAELDEFGRYKVKFPFDRSDRLGQKASRWIRMAQPFAGPDEGLHFPLRKGAEVLLTFMDGDPDRPIISAAVPGAEGQSPVIDQNSSMNKIQTSGGNYMHFEDLDGKQRILMSSPTANSWLRIGAPNDPPNPYSVSEGDEIAKLTDTDGDWRLVRLNGSTFSGSTRKAKTSDDQHEAVYEQTKQYFVWNDADDYKVITPVVDWNITENETPEIDTTYHNHQMNSIPSLSDNQIAYHAFEEGEEDDDGNFTKKKDYYLHVWRRADRWDVITPEEKTTLSEGAAPSTSRTYNFDNEDWKIDYGPSTIPNQIKLWKFKGRQKTVKLAVRPDVAEVEETKGEGVRIRSTDNVWIEAQDRYAIYTIGGPAAADRDTKVPEKIRYLWDKFYGSDPAFKPVGMQAYNYGDDVPNPVTSADLASLKTLARKGKVQLAQGDTFNTQEGNIYDFGGYWNYNLGNSYAECFMQQAGVELNRKQEFDLADAGGPNYTKIDDPTSKSLTQGPDFSSHGNSVWVTKKIGPTASYDYARDFDSLEAKYNCVSISHRHNQRSIEYQYNEDYLFTKIDNREGDGIKEEWAYAPGGAMYKYNFTDDQVTYIHEYKFGLEAKAACELAFGAESSFKLEGSIKTTAEVNLAGFVKAELAFSIGVTFKLSAAIEVELALGTKVDFKEDGSLGFKATGFKAEKEAAISSGLQQVKLDKTQLALNDLTLHLNKSPIKIVDGYIRLHKGQWVHL